MECRLLWLWHGQAVAHQHHQAVWRQLPLHTGHLNHVENLVTRLLLQLTFSGNFPLTLSLLTDRLNGLSSPVESGTLSFCFGCQLWWIKTFHCSVVVAFQAPRSNIGFVCVCCRWLWSSTVTRLEWRFLWGNTRAERSSSRPYRASATWEETHRQDSMLSLHLCAHLHAGVRRIFYNQEVLGSSLLDKNRFDTLFKGWWINHTKG